jgi:hypothetical protein
MSSLCLTKHHAVNTYWGVELSAELQASATSLTGKEPPAPNGFEAGWVPEPL